MKTFIDKIKKQWLQNSSTDILQSTDTVLMVTPDAFGYNEQTAVTNAFQQKPAQSVDAKALARNEFNGMVETLQKHNIHVITLSSPKNHITPDAVFPNNWFSLHNISEDKILLVLYPMLMENRQKERQVKPLLDTLNIHGIHITETIDLSHYENENRALEGTGSIIFDRKNKIAYACLSPRTDPMILNELMQALNYTAITFHSVDKTGKPIYHTNVMMSIGTEFAVIATESIPDKNEREKILQTLQQSNKNILQITPSQMEKMAGNILEVRSIDGTRNIILSNTAYLAFTTEQLEILKKYAQLIVVHIDTIEKLGGGSARCMLAEIFH